MRIVSFILLFILFSTVTYPTNMMWAISAIKKLKNSKMKIKHVLTGLIILASCFILSYLCGAFYNATFDISKWTTDSRGAIPALGVLAGCALNFFYLTESNNNNNKI